MKPDIWQPLAQELGVPWRSAECMHWILGEREMARRANVTPFSMISGVNTAGPQGEGNGRIAQASRMQEATNYFEPEHLDVLQTPSETNAREMAARESMSSMGDSATRETVRASLKSMEGVPATEAPVSVGYTRINGSGYHHPDEQVSPTTIPRVPEGLKRERDRDEAASGLYRLPPLKDLDRGFQHPNYAPPSRHSPQPLPPPTRHSLPSPPPPSLGGGGGTRLSGSHHDGSDANSERSSHSGGASQGSERLIALAEMSSKQREAQEGKLGVRDESEKGEGEGVGGKRSASRNSDGSEPGYVRVEPKGDEPLGVGAQRY